MKVRVIEHDNVIIGYTMESPLTGDVYCFYTKEANKSVFWEFNGDYEKPTFTPSMLNNQTGEHFDVIDGKVHYLMGIYSNKVMDMIDMD